MKFISWNVNGLRIAEAGFLYFIMKMFLLFIGSMVIVLVVNKKMVLLLMDKIKK